MKKIILIITSLLFSFSQSVFSQSGEETFYFLSLPSSSHVTALGGTNVSMYNHDLNFAMQNPGLLSAEMHNQLTLNAASYVADIFFGSAAYSYKLNDNHYLAGGILFLDYGKFTERNEYGDELGSFRPIDAAMYLMYGLKLSDHWTLGATLKPIFSSYEQYSSFALGVDVGMSYHLDDAGFSTGFVLKNLGRQLSTYYKEGNSGQYENLPFKIEIGATQRLKHAPFRFSVTAHDLQRWDMSYEKNLTETNAAGIVEKVDNELSFGENLMRHFIFGVEFIPSKNFYVSLAYNYQRNREMKVLDNKSLNGFSIGTGINIKMFSVGFGLAKYHMSNMTYHFSVSTDLNGFKR